MDEDQERKIKMRIKKGEALPRIWDVYLRNMNSSTKKLHNLGMHGYKDGMKDYYY